MLSMEATKKQKEIIDKWVTDMMDHGFMCGWFGDRGDEFKKSQVDCLVKVIEGDLSAIGGEERLKATIWSDYINLKKYCGWSNEELQEMLDLFGYYYIDEDGKLRSIAKEKIN